MVGHIAQIGTIWGPYGFTMWVVGGPMVTLPKYTPHGTHMGSIWVHHVGCRWANPYGAYVGLTWDIWAPDGPGKSHMGPSYFAV